MKLRERVARAISEAQGEPFSVTPSNPRHIVLMRQADFAISALMKALAEPSEAMVEALEDAWDATEAGGDMVDCWRAMLAQFARENVGIEEE